MDVRTIDGMHMGNMDLILNELTNNDYVIARVARVAHLSGALKTCK